MVGPKLLKNYKIYHFLNSLLLKNTFTNLKTIKKNISVLLFSL